MMTFEFPLPPNLLNERVHWRVKNKERKRYFAVCDTLLAAKRLPEAPEVPLTPVVLHSVLYLAGTKLHDDDNAMARGYKWPVDWLRTRGYIEDDGRPHCRMTIPEQFFDRKRPRLVVRVELDLAITDNLQVG